MSDEQEPGMMYEISNTGCFLAGVLLLSCLIILENAPSESIDLLLIFASTAYIIALAVVFVILLQGRTVFGHAGGSAYVPGFIFGAIVLWLTTYTNVSSTQITLVALIGLLLTLTVGAEALNSAHFE
jgi:hypothetical protein